MAPKRNANGRFVKGGKKGGGKRSGGGSRGIRNRRGVGKIPIRVAEAGGGLMVAAGALLLPGSDGSTVLSSGQGVSRYTDVLDNARDVFTTADAYWQPTRNLVLGGAALMGAGKVIRHVHPRAGSASRMLSKILHHKVRLA